MKSLWLTLVGLLSLVALSACATTRPTSAICPSPVLSRDLGVSAGTSASTRSLTQAIMTAAKTDRRGPVEINAISLSAGGQWGAFGAGLLTGWSANTTEPRPEFDLVTGVSAGAILSVPAFAGSDFDPALSFYRGLTEGEVLTRNPFLGVLGEPAVANAAPLEALLRSLLTPQMLTRLAARHAQGNRLFIGATNLDTTAIEFFDLGALAGDPNIPNDDNQGCITEALLASSAIPGLMAPRHINGALYVDGGIRDQVFFQEIEKARALAETDLKRRVKVNAYVVVNGPLEPPENRVEDNSLSYFLRSVSILSDEILRDSLIEAIDFADRRSDWTLRGIIPTVDAAECSFTETPILTFDECLTRVLFDAGVATGQSGAIPWLDADGLRQAALEF